MENLEQRIIDLENKFAEWESKYGSFLEEEYKTRQDKFLLLGVKKKQKR